MPSQKSACTGSMHCVYGTVVESLSCSHCPQSFASQDIQLYPLYESQDRPKLLFSQTHTVLRICFVLCRGLETQIVVQKTLFVAGTLCKRTLLRDIPGTRIFSIIKQWIKQTSVFIYKFLSTMFLVCSVPYVKQFYAEAHIAPKFK